MNRFDNSKVDVEQVAHCKVGNMYQKLWIGSPGNSSPALISPAVQEDCTSLWPTMVATQPHQTRTCEEIIGENTNRDLNRKVWVSNWRRHQSLKEPNSTTRCTNGVSYHTGETPPDPPFWLQAKRTFLGIPHPQCNPLTHESMTTTQYLHIMFDGTPLKRVVESSRVSCITSGFLFDSTI